MVAQKLKNQEIDHKESRTLVIPFLKNIGVVQLGRSGAFIEVRTYGTEGREGREVFFCIYFL